MVFELLEQNELEYFELEMDLEQKEYHLLSPKEFEYFAPYRSKWIGPLKL